MRLPNQYFLKTFLFGIIGLSLVSGCTPGQKTIEEKQPLQSENEYSDQIRLRAVNDAIAKEPDNVIGYMKRSQVYLQLGETDRALTDARTAVRMDSANGPALTNLVVCYRKAKKLDSAAIIIGVAKKQGYTSPALLVSSGEILLIARRYSTALEELNEALALSPQNPEAYFFKGIIYEEQGDTTNAINAYTTAIAQNPQMIDCYNKLAGHYSRRNQFQLAQQYLKAGLRFAPQDALLNYNLGTLFNDRNMPDSAENYLQRAVFYEPTFYLAHFNLGMFRYKERKYIEAATHLENALVHNNAQPAARFYLGLCREFSGNLDDAARQYQQVLQLGQGYETDAQKRLLSIKARLAKKDQAEEAEALLPDSSL
jgi:tetratricopeptide (TPR) repeat protein